MCSDNLATLAKAPVHNNTVSDKDNNQCLLTCLTWTIEGVTRNLLDLKQRVDHEDPDLIFLQEPMCFQCDLTKINDILGDKYCSILNSDDKFDPELPLQKLEPMVGALPCTRNTLNHFSLKLKLLPAVFSPSFLKSLAMSQPFTSISTCPVQAKMPNILKCCLI